VCHYSPGQCAFGLLFELMRPKTRGLVPLAADFVARILNLFPQFCILISCFSKEKAMQPALKKCETQALKLKPKDRAKLAEHLIASLDELDNAENERLWIEEADRRYKEYKKSRIPSRSAKDAIDAAMAAIR